MEETVTREAATGQRTELTSRGRSVHLGALSGSAHERAEFPDATFPATPDAGGEA